MRPLKILVVDDEKLAREEICFLLDQIGGCELVGEASDGVSALRAAGELKPDLMFLDIQMPGLTGFEVARRLVEADLRSQLVFVTAFDQYALDAFEAQAVGYLLKPVRREKLVRAIRHAARVAGPQLARVAEQAQIGVRRSQVCTRLGDQLKLVPVADVLYFTAEQKYVTMRHLNGRELIDESLRALEQEFAPDFVRIHRNSLVARQYIDTVERTPEGQLVVRFKQCDDVLQVSRRNAAEALRQIRTGA